MTRCLSCGHTSKEPPPLLKTSNDVEMLLHTKLSTPESLGSHLRSVRNEATRVEGLVKQLQHELSRLRAHMNDLTPISRLPAEILSEIFAYATPYLPNPEYITHPELLSPFFLGAVCKRWRNIAWTTPTLWNHISLCITSPSRYSVQAELLVGWLERARELPLAIRLTTKPDVVDVPAIWDRSEPIGDREDPTLIFNILFNHTKQWKIIDFALDRQWFHHLENTHPYFEFPLLEKVALQCLNRNTAHIWDRLDLFAGSKRLRELHLNGFLYSNFHGVPWQMIENLILAHSQLQETGIILSEANNVRDVLLSNIYRVHWIATSFGETADITLPEAASFSVLDTPAHCLSHIMDRIILPEVKKIHLSTPCPAAEDDFRDERFDQISFGWSFNRWAKQWSSNITLLKIEAEIDGTKDLLRGLSEVVSLENIEIVNFSGSHSLEIVFLARSLIEGAQVNDDQDILLYSEKIPFRPFLPNLRDFQYTGAITDDSMKLLVQALRYRRSLILPPSLSVHVQPESMEGIKQLETFLIYTPVTTSLPHHNDVIEEIYRLDDDGMSFDIFVGDTAWTDL